MLKIAFASLFCFLFFHGICQKQSYKHPSALGIHFTLYDFKNSKPLKKLNDNDKGLSLSYLKGINNHLDWQITVSGLFPDSIMKKNIAGSEKSLLLQGDFAIRTRLRDNDRLFQPYVLTGTGLSYYQNNVSGYLLAGPGIELGFKDVYIQINAQYRLSLSNNLNSHFFYSMGIAGLLSKPKKQQQAIIPAVVEKPMPASDRDRDGTPDSLDSCPDQPGPSRLNGCPDTDGDGIVDKDDLCPTVYGYEKYSGCPFSDLDKDGIRDEEDQCPNIAGVLKYHGCPVPDKDKDGVNDEEDKCPEVPGAVRNNGCPVIADKITNQINLAAKNVLFKTGSYELDPKSFSALDEVVEIFKENKILKIVIEGHTDNIGTESSNQLLSENRAKAVASYLSDKGIDQSRISYIGYGMKKPIADNSTSEGRSINRRVEMKVYY